MNRIYLDHNATTPLAPAVAEAMLPYATEYFGNPASATGPGARLAGAEDARETVARILDAEPDEVIFTSGATEANNLALFGLAGSRPGPILASPIEHPSVDRAAQPACRGASPRIGSPVSTGFGDRIACRLRRTAGADTRLVSVMLGEQRNRRHSADCRAGNTPGWAGAVSLRRGPGGRPAAGFVPWSGRRRL